MNKQLEPASPWLARTTLKAFRPKFGDHPGKWGDKRLAIPYSTQEPVFILDRAPHLLPAFEALGNPKYKKIDIRGPAGSGKSLIGELDICFCTENDPGLYYYVWPNDQDAKDQVEDRIYPLFQSNDFLCNLLPVDRSKKRNTKIVFPDMSFYSVGANESNAQRVRAYRLTMEEPHMFNSGMLTKMRKRMKGVQGARELTLSTGSELDHQTDVEFKNGSCHEFHIPCPHCGHMQAPVTSHIKWDKTENTTDENGEYRWEALRKTMRHECEECGKPFPQKASERLKIAKQGKAIQTNPNAPDDHFSYHYHAAVVDWISIEEIAEEYIKAIHATRIGNLELFKDFVQKTEANAWDESPPQDNREISERFGGYVKLDHWPDEICRFMTVDNQAGKASKGENPHRWVLTRAWGAAESRLVDERKVDTWEDVEVLRDELGVAANRVLVDIAYDRQEVLKMCEAFGWQGLIGNERRKSFPHKGKDERGQPATFQLPYSPPQRGYINIGKRGRNSSAIYYDWCHEPIKALYHQMAQGNSPDYLFSVADDVSEDYQKHIKAEFRRKDKSGKWVWFRPEHLDDHHLDNEQMNVAAACMDIRLPIGKSLRSLPIPGNRKES
ncbi:MAG: terminase gpA endonuclease subunit [Verrucomicrobiota bacterium]